MSGCGCSGYGFRGLGEDYVGPSCPAGYTFKFDQATSRGWCEDAAGNRAVAPGFTPPDPEKSTAGLGVLGWSIIGAGALVLGALVLGAKKRS